MDFFFYINFKIRYFSIGLAEIKEKQTVPVKFQSGFSILFLFVLFLGCIMWDLSSPTGDRTQSPALQGRFLINGPPGKSLYYILWKEKKDYFFLTRKISHWFPHFYNFFLNMLFSRSFLINLPLTSGRWVIVSEK